MQPQMPAANMPDHRPQGRFRTTASHGRVRSVASGARSGRPCNKDRTELINQALTKMIITDMLPISFVTSPGFREFMAVAEPNFVIPCPKSIKSRIILAYDRVATKIAAEMSKVPFVAWTSDCWSSRSQNSYISVTTHFLDSNWVPKNYTLASEELSERHTAANLTDKLENIMEHWQLNGKVTAVVTDNAQAAQNAVRDLDVCFNTGVTCAAHSLQLCINKALKYEDGADLCEKASKIVAHFRHSNVATTALEKKQDQLGLKPLKLIQNCITRWDSTFAMIERLLSNRCAVTNVLTDRAITKSAVAERLEISEREWLNLEKLAKLLKPLQVATTVFCSDSHSPISIVRPIIYTLRDKHLHQSDDDDVMIKQIKKILRDELTTRFNLVYDCYIGVDTRQVASFLDPRYKDLLTESAEARIDIRKFVREQLIAEPIEEQEDNSQETAMDFLFQSAPKCNSSLAQLEMYLSEPQISHNMDTFEWWATREKRYPALADLARKYLCIPATSASSERVFSTAGNIVTSKRNCLLPQNVNILVFTYQNRDLLYAK